MNTFRSHIMIATLVTASLLMLGGCQEERAATKNPRWGEIDGHDVHLYTLTNAKGMQAQISDYGGILVRLTAPDRTGHYSDVVLGYNTLAEYRQPDHSPYFGAIVGRYGNRIADGHFTLDGTTYTLATNNKPAGIPCALHGGLKGFDKVVWTATPVIIEGDQSLELRYHSAAGEEGYPGNLDVTVTYRLKADNSLSITFSAVTDKATPVNLTNHSYFNLKGEGFGDILDTELTIVASRFLPVTPGMIPTGELRPVAGTPFDFTAPHAIGERIEAKDEQLTLGSGYDHSFVLDRHSQGLELAARAHEPTSGRTLEVFTTEPGVQLYTANWLPSANDPLDKQLVGKSGRLYYRRNAFCLETQHYPDSPNHPDFPTTILKPGEQYHSTTVFKFLAE